MSSSQILGGSGFCNFGLHVFLTPSLTSTFANTFFYSTIPSMKTSKIQDGRPKMAHGVWEGECP